MIVRAAPVESTSIGQKAAQTLYHAFELAHWLGLPLNTHVTINFANILGSINLLEKRLARGETDVTRYIEAAKDGANRAASLTHRLLVFSRRKPLKPEVIDANRMIAGMSELLARSLGETISVETVLAAGL